jgi:cell division protein FtsB
MRKPTLAPPAGASSVEKPAARNARAPRGARIPRPRGGRPSRYSFRFSGLTFVILAVLVAFVVVLAPGLRLYIEQRQQLAALQQTVTDQEQQSAELGAQVARWSDPAYIKAQARDRLYFVMPGETSFLVIDDQPPTAPADAPVATTGIQNTRVDWLGSIFSSGLQAGLSSQTPEELQKTGTIQ